MADNNIRSIEEVGTSFQKYYADPDGVLERIL